MRPLGEMLAPRKRSTWTCSRVVQVAPVEDPSKVKTLEKEKRQREVARGCFNVGRLATCPTRAADASVERNRDSAAGAEKEQSQIQAGSRKPLNAAAGYLHIPVGGRRQAFERRQ